MKWIICKLRAIHIPLGFVPLLQYTRTQAHPCFPILHFLDSCRLSFIHPITWFPAHLSRGAFPGVTRPAFTFSKFAHVTCNRYTFLKHGSVKDFMRGVDSTKKRGGEPSNAKSDMLNICTDTGRKRNNQRSWRTKPFLLSVCRSAHTVFIKINVLTFFLHSITPRPYLCVLKQTFFGRLLQLFVDS